MFSSNVLEHELSHTTTYFKINCFSGKKKGLQNNIKFRMMPKIQNFTSISIVILLFKSICWDLLWEFTYFFTYITWKTCFRYFYIAFEISKETLYFCIKSKKCRIQTASKNFVQRDVRKILFENLGEGTKV